ncbi:MAG: hypothetical protein LPK38_06370, partial [Actinomycetes bacterium]|nr:hypothetical protein [Actinomycetes bacterium]MDX5400006.1 hypothetical protein [Actinomycetes bacterium]MDX5450665.1 hypothetical protein [Actinomycetes bacterium]
MPWAQASGAVVVGATGSGRIDATSTASAVTVALSLQGSTAFSGGGAVALNLIAGTTNATVTSARLVAVTTLSITTGYSARIDALVAALSVAVGGAATGTTPGIAIGVSVARNLIGWEEFGGVDPILVKARAISSDLEATGDITISAASTAIISAIVEATSVAVAASTDTAFAVSVGGLFTDNKIGARIEASATNTAIETDGALYVTASDTSRITADARAAGVGASLPGGMGGAGSIGLAIAFNEIDVQVLALIANPGVVIAPGGVFITATNSSQILVQSIAVAVAVAIAGGTPALALAGGGAVAINQILGSTRAGV